MRQFMVIVFALLAVIYGLLLSVLAFVSAVAFAVIPVLIGTAVHFLMRLFKRLK